MWPYQAKANSFLFTYLQLGHLLLILQMTRFPESVTGIHLAHPLHSQGVDPVAKFLGQPHVYGSSTLKLTPTELRARIWKSQKLRTFLTTYQGNLPSTVSVVATISRKSGFSQLRSKGVGGGGVWAILI